jgi:hypothetical protein
VVIGNPPYNVGQVSENDNNKNRRYKVIDERIRQTYVRDSKATKTKAYDAYVRFFRWATDRLQGRDGIVCFVSNNSFLDQTGFDGMRKHVLQDFTQIYHLDLHGNVRKNPKLSGTTHNVFGIQVGVGITIAVRKTQNAANPNGIGTATHRHADRREASRRDTPSNGEMVPLRRAQGFGSAHHDNAEHGTAGAERHIRYYRVPEDWTKVEKLAFLNDR